MSAVQKNHWLTLLMLVDGLDVVDKIESVGSQSGKTAKKVVVKDCGEL